MKKVCAKTCLFVLAVLLLFAVAQFCVLCTPRVEIARADNTVTVIKAPVSNLEGNAYAGISTVSVFDSQDRMFYIPESYFLYSPETFIENRIYQISYCDIDSEFRLHDIDYNLYELPETTQIIVGEDEAISPDVSLMIKEDAEVTLGSVTLNNEYTIKLLGYNEDGSEIYVCATYNGASTFGFIPAISLEPFTVPYQQRAQSVRDALLAAKEKPIISDGNLPAPNTSVALRIVLIIGIAVPALIIVLLLFKPSKDERRYAKTSVRRDRADRIDYDDPYDQRRNSDYRYRYSDRGYDRRDDRGRYDSRRDDRYDRDDDRGYDRGDRYDRDDRY